MPLSLTSTPDALVLRLKYGRNTLFYPVRPSTKISSIREGFVAATKPTAEEVGLFIRREEQVFMPLNDGTVQSAGLKEADVLCVGFRENAAAKIAHPIVTYTDQQLEEDAYDVVEVDKNGVAK